MGGAGQWTLDHRRSLTRHRKQEVNKDKREEEREQTGKKQKERKKKSISGPLAR